MIRWDFTRETVLIEIRRKIYEVLREEGDGRFVEKSVSCSAFGNFVHIWNSDRVLLNVVPIACVKTIIHMSVSGVNVNVKPRIRSCVSAPL